MIITLYGPIFSSLELLLFFGLFLCYSYDLHSLPLFLCPFFSYLFSNPPYHVCVACYSPTPLHLPISDFLFFSYYAMFSFRYMDSEGRVKQLTAAVRAELLTVIDNMAKVSPLIACSIQDSLSSSRWQYGTCDALPYCPLSDYSNVLSLQSNLTVLHLITFLSTSSHFLRTLSAQSP